MPDEQIVQNNPVKNEPIKLPNLQTVLSLESAICGLSIRAIIALILVVALVTYPLFHIDIPAVISNLGVAAVSFYFGKNQK
jgi:hypothetical protein